MSAQAMFCSLHMSTTPTHRSGTVCPAQKMFSFWPVSSSRHSTIVAGSHPGCKFSLVFCNLLGQAQNRCDILSFSGIFGHVLNGPFKRRPEGFVEHCATGFADGRQSSERPFLRTALLELTHE